MWDTIKGPNTKLQTIIDKGILLPALSYSRWMPVEAKVTYRISEIFIDLEKIPDGRDFHYVDKAHTLEWEDAVYEIDYPVLGRGQIRRNNIKEELEDPWSLSIPKGKGKTKFVQDLKTKDWYTLSILLLYEDRVPSSTIEQLHMSIVSVQNKTLRELMVVFPRNIDTPFCSLRAQYPLRRDAGYQALLKLTKETINNTLSAITPWIKPQ